MTDTNSPFGRAATHSDDDSPQNAMRQEYLRQLSDAKKLLVEAHKLYVDHRERCRHGLEEGMPYVHRGSEEGAQLDFSGEDLRFAQFADANFSDADLDRAQFRRASLQDCDFYRADLQRSKFGRVKFRGTNFPTRRRSSSSAKLG